MTEIGHLVQTYKFYAYIQPQLNSWNLIASLYANREIEYIPYSSVMLWYEAKYLVRAIYSVNLAYLEGYA